MGRHKKEDVRIGFYQKMPIIEKEEIDRYASAYHMDKQDVAMLIRQMGWKEFRKRYPLDLVRKAKKKAKDKDKDESEYDKYRKKKLHDIFFDYENSEKYGWQQV